LAKAHYATANTEAEAIAYARRIEGQLDQGIIPAEIFEPIPAETVADWARLYLVQVAISASDQALLNDLLNVMAGWPVSNVSMSWAQSWVSDLKRVHHLSPSSIRHKVGAVARLLDWCVRSEWLTVNPLRQLPRRYASYSAGDGEKREDIERDRRLLPGEYERIMLVLSGAVADNKQRGLQASDLAAWRLLFVLAVESAMRLREMYTLHCDQVDLLQKTVFLDKTKNGDKRQVPLSSVAVAALREHFAVSGERVFPWWDGKPASLARVTAQLSRKWGTIAKLAGCDDLRFHDLRHEACCRFYERTTLGDVQIARITGHKDLRMLRRYSNLRGSDLAEWLW
jgi:integrase